MPTPVPKETLPPKIQFFDSHRPQLDPGDYTLTVNQALSHDKIKSQNKAKAILNFSVRGERFNLKPIDINSLFPGAGVSGEFDTVLPHITLSRSTLPWERHAIKKHDNLPWLVLLLFQEDESPSPKSITLKSIAPIAEDVYWPSTDLEQAQHPDDSVTVIDVPRTTLESIMPSTEDLPLLAHVRRGEDEQGNQVGEEHAVIICNRLPKHGMKNTVHLVSVENRFNDTGFDFGNKEKIRLVSLKHWSFYSVDHFRITTDVLDKISGFSTEDRARLESLIGQEIVGTDKTFQDQIKKLLSKSGDIPFLDELTKAAYFSKTFSELINNLKGTLSTLRLPKPSDLTAASSPEPYFAEGLVALPHHFRTGDQSASWYRGPFTPIQKTWKPDILPAASTADELLRYFPDQGMFDVSYAAAWELGRLLALQDKNFSLNLYHWRCLKAQAQHHQTQRNASQHLPKFAHSTPQNTDSLQLQVKQWLTSLGQFKNVPANYLIPDEALLPVESMRFFEIDPLWQEALLKGALSIAWNPRLSQDSSQSDIDLTSFFKDSDQPSPTCGLLIRSEVIIGWPGLLIAGHTEPIPENSDNTAMSENVLLSRITLAPNILLYLFSKPVQTIELYRRPEQLHFGFDQVSGATYPEKRIDQSKKTLTANEFDLAARTIKATSLAKLISSDGDSAAFAVSMIERSPKFKISIHRR